MKSEKFDEIFKKINTPEYKSESLKENQEYYDNLDMDYQLGYFVGEKIVTNYLPTITTDGITSRNCIKVSEEDTIENKRLDDEWFSTTRYGSNHNKEDKNGDKEKWDLYYQHNKMLERKYLPPTLTCHLPLIRFVNETQFKEGIKHSLWDCDMCSYNIDIENIKIENDMEMCFTKIIFQYDPNSDIVVE